MAKKVLQRVQDGWLTPEEERERRNERHMQKILVKMRVDREQRELEEETKATLYPHKYGIHQHLRCMFCLKDRDEIDAMKRYNRRICKARVRRNEMVTFTKGECDMIYMIISQLSGGNPENIFAWDGTDSIRDSIIYAAAKLYKAAGERIPDEVEKQLAEEEKENGRAT